MTGPARVDPFGLALGGLAADHFPRVRDAILADRRDPRQRDEFLLVREVNQLMRELRPDEGLGDAAVALGALVHAAFLFWLDGELVVPVDDARLSRLVAAPARARPALAEKAAYVQLPAFRVWGVPVVASSPEPLDGWFRSARGEQLTMVAIFGLHPGREGFTVVDVTGPAPADLVRADGSPLFAPTLDGGRAAGLVSVVGEEELLELAWRVEGDL